VKLRVDWSTSRWNSATKAAAAATLMGFVYPKEYSGKRVGTC